MFRGVSQIFSYLDCRIFPKVRHVILTKFLADTVPTVYLALGTPLDEMASAETINNVSSFEDNRRRKFALTVALKQ